MHSVLIVDDEMPSRVVVKKLGCWEEIGVDHIYEADTVEAAIKLIRVNHPEIIITDMNMPEVDGVALLQRIIEENYAPYILVVSGYTNFEYTHQAIISRVHNYLLKPVNQTELNRNLREIYNQLESDISETASSAERISGSTMEDIREYIEINYATNITLNRLSKDFFFSKEHISRSFRQKYGVRLFDYVNECRLKHVCDLLKRTDMSIDEIAIRCGFSCGNYLRKVFKKQYGVAPSEYRLAH